MNKQRIKKLIEHLETCEYVSTKYETKHPERRYMDLVETSCLFNMERYFVRSLTIQKPAEEIRKNLLVPKMLPKKNRTFSDSFVEFPVQECKSPSCIAGHTVALFYENIDQVHPINCVEYAGNQEEWLRYSETFYYAKALLELFDKQAGALFTPEETDVSIDGKRVRDMEGEEYKERCRFFIYNLMTPQAAIRTLKYLLQTGEVLWILKSEENPEKEAEDVRNFVLPSRGHSLRQ